MKKIRRIWPVFLLFVLLCFSVNVRGSENKEDSRVADEYGLFSTEEKEELEQELAEIYDRYQFDTVFLISEDIGEDMDYRMYAAEYMQENEIGYGEEHNGMCLFHQPDARNVTIVFRGPYQDDFTEKVQDIMLDHCTEKLKKEEVFEAYQGIVTDLERGLARVSRGKKIRSMDMEGGNLVGEILKWILVSFGVMAVPTLIMTLYQRGRMKTVVPQSNADAYTSETGPELRNAQDIFLRVVTTKTPIPKDQDHGGNSGSFSSGGESFSGSSRDY